MRSLVAKVLRAAAVGLAVSTAVLVPNAYADGTEIAPPQRLPVPAGVEAAGLALFDQYGRQVPLTVRDGEVIPPALPGGGYELRWDGGVETFTVMPWESEEFGAGVHEGGSITERGAPPTYEWRRCSASWTRSRL
jgi:hypothetical protein